MDKMDDHLCGRKRRRDVRLRFQGTCRLRWVEKITNEIEIIDMWYALEDTRRFRREFEHESMITEMSDYCVTGIHEDNKSCRVRRSQDASCPRHSSPTPTSGRNVHQSRKERRRRQRQSQKSRYVVLKEQYFQYCCGLNDPDTIAQSYSEVSERSLEEALERAQRVLSDLNNDEPTETSTREMHPFT